MHTIHAGLSIAIPVNKKNEQCAKHFLEQANIELQNYLDSKGNGTKESAPCCMFPFDKMHTTLSASAVILPTQYYAVKPTPNTIQEVEDPTSVLHSDELPPTLLFLTSYSGPLDMHVKELVEIAGKGLRMLFKHCNISDDLDDNDDLIKFLKKFNKQSTYYTGFQGITRADVLGEEELREEIGSFLKAEGHNLETRMPEEVQLAIRNHVTKNKSFDWVKGLNVNYLTQLRKNKINLWLKIAGCVVLILIPPAFWAITESFVFKALTITEGSLVLLLLLMILITELRDKDSVAHPKDEKLEMIASVENNRIINEMTAAGPLKKGLLRIILFKVVLRGVAIYLRLFPFTIPTVANARWIAVDKGKRLVFISNFLNLSESYVRDFIDTKASARYINLLFGFGSGYPRTTLVVTAGAIKDPDGFVRVFQKNQHLTPFWYWPYKELSVDNILKNRKIREGLYADLNSKQLREWLSLL